MKVFTRMAAYVAAAIVLGLVLSNFAGSWFDGQADIIQLSRWIVHEARRKEALRHRTEMVARIQEARKEIIAEVVAGRLSLCQAIDQFQAANGLVENVDVDLVGRYLTPTEPEGIARQTLAWVDVEAESSPSAELWCTLMVLDDEFREMFGSPRLDEESLDATE